ncbi:P-loop containing nucleoside triphosphate hydrolase protein [Thelonectria olida]|uniref:P-loop containing nucleoside triphosphate hydrolase protein n=1 Tax=Thelonectria olida TaxID=1576542 RepID=A0A9P8WF45_9HYPO|nr:P-loop containing nucleoside triphosphate hydrolase protein [Thelonectria olida]
MSSQLPETTTVHTENSGSGGQPVHAGRGDQHTITGRDGVHTNISTQINNYTKGSEVAGTIAPNEIRSYPPFSKSPLKTFVGRQSLLDRIRSQFLRESGDEDKTAARIVGIWGLGGAGKSQLALRYKQKYGAEYKASFWVQAKDLQSLRLDFRDIYNSIQVGRSQDASPPKDEEVRDAVVRMLAEGEERWLMVFDEADHLHDNDKAFFDIRQYIPASSNIHVIITSRSSLAGELSTWDGVEVGMMTEEEAMDLLAKTSKADLSTSEARSQAEDIVKKLGLLPLAIAIAGAYIATAPRLSSNLSLWLQEFDEKRRRMLEKNPRRLVDNYDKNVMTVWETSYSAILDHSPDTCLLFDLLAFFDSEDIHAELFAPKHALDLHEGENPWTYIAHVKIGDTTNVVENPLASVLGLKGDANVDCIEDSLAMLERYSMITSNRANGSFAMHTLVHAWCRERQEVQLFGTNRPCIAALLLILNAYKSNNQRQGTLRLVPHIRKITQAALQAKFNPSEEAMVYYTMVNIGWNLYRHGSYEDASLILEVALQKARNVYGPHSAETIVAKLGLAESLVFLFKLDEAIKLQTEVIEDAPTVFGDQHKLVLRAKTGLEDMTVSREKTKHITRRMKPLAQNCESFALKLRIRLTFLYSLMFCLNVGAKLVDSLVSIALKKAYTDSIVPLARGACTLARLWSKIIDKTIDRIVSFQNQYRSVLTGALQFVYGDFRVPNKELLQQRADILEEGSKFVPAWYEMETDFERLLRVLAFGIGNCVTAWGKLRESIEEYQKTVQSRTAWEIGVWKIEEFTKKLREFKF